MAPEMQTHRETQEQSIKARKSELFEEEVRESEGGPARPFRAYLETTPATPLSLGIKASLWSMGVVVGLLFVAGVAGGKTRAKVPEGLVVPVNVRPSPIASLHPSPAVKPPGPSIKEDKPKKPSRPDDKNKKNQAKKTQDKKPKDKKPSNKKPSDKKPKPEAIAKAGSPQPEPPKPAPSQPNATAATEPRNPVNPPAAPAPGVAAKDSATKPGNAAKPAATASPDSKTPQVNPQPNQDTSKEPAKKKSNLFKKKPMYNPAMPPREQPRKKELLPEVGGTSTPSTTPSP
jgi:hypothetical protein